MAGKTPKLHEIIAVIDDANKGSAKIIEESIVTFTKKAEHFYGQVVKKTFFDVAREAENVTTAKPLVTTVPEKLDYLASQVSPYFDLLATREIANTEAFADLEVDGKVLIAKIPATLLLALESRLKDIRRVYEAIPTLEPNKEWVSDPQAAKDGVYKTTLPEVRFHTEKKLMSKILVAATDKHPAQIEKWTEDQNVAKSEMLYQTGALAPIEKSKILGRLDSLIAAVKRARQRANAADAPKVSIGRTIFDFIHKG